MNELKTHRVREYSEEDIKTGELLSKSEKGGIFAWVPSFRVWLKDPGYAFWLGAGGL